MAVPANFVAQNGVSQISADNLNTCVQTVNTVASLRGFIGTGLQQVVLEGSSSPGDGGQGTFYWNSTGVAADDGGVTTVVPNGVSVGCWTRIGHNYISSTLPLGSAVALTNAVPANITSITLPPGVWLLWGNFVTIPAASTTTSSSTISISTTSATNAPQPNGGAFTVYSSSVAAGFSIALPTGTMRVSITASTTYYLVVDVGFAVSTMSAYGFLGAVPSA